MDIIYAALYVIQQSGKYNIYEFNKVLSSAICILSVWGNLEAFNLAMKAVSSKQFCMKILQNWIQNYETQHQQWKKIADVCPYGSDYLNAKKKYDNAQTDIQWTDIVSKAEELCYQKGLYAKNIIQLKCIQNASDISLKVIGAQLLIHI